MFRSKNEPVENIKYIFCASMTKLVDNKFTDKVLKLKELENAILNGNENRLAIFSFELQTLQDAEWFGKELSELNTKVKDNYWIIQLEISPVEYRQHYEKFELFTSIGEFLHPLKKHILSCTSPYGATITFDTPYSTWCSVM